MTPILYESITVDIDNEELMENVETWPFSQTLYTTRNPVQQVRGITIISQIHRKIEQRCPHNKMGEDAWMYEDEAEDEWSSFARLRDSLMPLLEACRRVRLRWAVCQNLID